MRSSSTSQNDSGIVPFDGMQRFLDFEFESFSPDAVVISWEVQSHILQRNGIVHGGAYCAVVEAAASRGAALWWGDRGDVVGVTNLTNFLRPVRGGRLRVVATPLHRGSLQQLWDVRITDNEERTVAQGQVRIQNLASRR
jgi:1,4-dihydroxy-2-naphthoyl-CoA hydrolase